MKALKKVFDEVYSDLKDEFKKYPIRLLNKEKEGVLGDCNHLVNPPIITIYLKSIEKQTENALKEHLKNILTHELIHALQPSSELKNQKENEAYEKMRKLKFFKS